MKPYLISAADTSMGVVLSAAAALLLAVFGPHFTTRAVLPWIFIAILVALSARYGAMVSLLGSVIAVVVFARRLYEPFGSLTVADASAKASLGWMALIAVSASYLLFPNQNRRMRH